MTKPTFSVGDRVTAWFIVSQCRVPAVVVALNYKIDGIPEPRILVKLERSGQTLPYRPEDLTHATP